MKNRTATVERKTRETDIRISLTIEGKGVSRVETGMPFLNHMLELFSKHSLIDLTIKAAGDLEVDYHHTVEVWGWCWGIRLTRRSVIEKGLYVTAGPMFPWMTP